MSVIVINNKTKEAQLFVKGSPEIIHSLSQKDSIPKNYFESLEAYTSKGLRVIAIASKFIVIDDFTEIETLERDKLESDIRFVGLIAMKNKVKPESLSAIQKLQHADIDTLMATGDNLLTAASVSQECHLISPNTDYIIADVLPGAEEDTILLTLNIS